MDKLVVFTLNDGIMITQYNPHRFVFHELVIITHSEHTVDVFGGLKGEVLLVIDRDPMMRVETRCRVLEE